MRYIANTHDDNINNNNNKVQKSVDCLLLFPNLTPWTESRTLTGPCFLVEGSTGIIKLFIWLGLSPLFPGSAGSQLTLGLLTDPLL